MIAIKISIIGFLFGGLCGYFNLPIPAPPSIEGVLGVVFLFIGYSVMR